MPTLAAVLCRTEEGWAAADVDLDSAETLEDLAELAVEGAAEAGGDDGLAVLLVEQVDEWFAVVRVEPDEEPRAFVSDATSALRHALGEMLLPELAEPVPDLADLEVQAGLAEPGDPAGPAGLSPPGGLAGPAGLADGFDAADGAGALPAASTPAGTQAVAGPAGDAAVLADLGVPAAELVAIAADTALLPADALLAVARGLGGEDALEAVR